VTTPDFVLTARLAPGLDVLQPFIEAQLIGPGEAQICATYVRLAPQTDNTTLIALAFAARAARLGHVCIELPELERLGPDPDSDAPIALAWPDASSWINSLDTSPLVARPESGGREPLRPLVLDGPRVYLQRLFTDEVAVATELLRRCEAADDDLLGDRDELDTVLDEIFGPEPVEEPDAQRLAARSALTGKLTVIAGGPGTGKTHTLAGLLTASIRLGMSRARPIEVAICAPTGKAAARINEALGTAVARIATAGALDASVAEALGSTTATTIHRLLGATSSAGFARNARNPLHHDLVVVDEMSMVSLPLMAALLDAVRPTSGIVLVGDPSQLTSIEAGSVMRDIVGPAAPGAPGHGPLDSRVVVLDRRRRFASGSAIAELADAVRDGRSDDVISILDDAPLGVSWVRADDREGLASVVDRVVERAAQVVSLARSGEAPSALEACTSLKVLTAIRRQPHGLYDWTRKIEAGLTTAVGAIDTSRRFYVGRPVIVTANDYANHLANGEAGLVVRHGDRRDVVFAADGALRYVAPSQLAAVETWWAMTIHKSQGSEYDSVVVSLPEAGSPVLSRELLYTAVTRAKLDVTVVASAAAIRAAVEHPVARASGLRDRLWPHPRSVQ